MFLFLSLIAVFVVMIFFFGVLCGMEIATARWVRAEKERNSVEVNENKYFVVKIDDDDFSKTIKYPFVVDGEK